MTRSTSVSKRSSSKNPHANPADEIRSNPALSAALASHKPSAPTPPPKRLTKNGFVSSGALAAAARAGTGRTTLANSAVKYGNGSQQKLSADRPVVGSRNGSTTSLLSSTSASGTHDHDLHTLPSFRQASPSHIAAVRAAARSTTPSATGVVRNTRISPPRRIPSPERKDETPIPATNKLVQLFEARSKTGNSEVRPVTASGPPVVFSPKPVRAASIKSITRERLPSQPLKAPAVSPPRGLQESADVPRKQRPAQLNRNPRVSSPNRTPSRSSAWTATVSPLHDQPISPQNFLDKEPPRPYDAGPRSHSLDRTLSDVKEARSAATLDSPAPSIFRRGSTPDRSLTTQMAVPQGGRREMSRPRSAYQPRKIQPHLNVDALANAMVASSLASSRAPSPHKPAAPDPYKFPPQPPPSRRGGKSAAMSFLYSQHSGQTKIYPRPPSPNKTTLKQTLRKQPTGPEDERRGRPANYDGRGGKLRKHVGISSKPSAMDRIDPADRKLYEGVWAANRGLLATEEELRPRPPPPRGQRPRAAEEVHGLVVKDLWKRSGLDDTLLEQIWELVDGAEGVKISTPGRLDRVEFVVGLWLVDQALMGRKLPRRLPESVWESIRVGPALTFRR